MSVLKAERVSKFFGDFPALRDLTFQFEAGDCVALLGRNGAGKTTLLNLMAGLSRPSTGSLNIVRRVSLLGHGIGVYDELSARENLKFFASLSPANIDIDAWLSKVNLLDVADAPLREYSRGMRQRLALARVLDRKSVV